MVEIVVTTNYSKHWLGARWVVGYTDGIHHCKACEHAAHEYTLTGDLCRFCGGVMIKRIAKWEVDRWVFLVECDG